MMAGAHKTSDNTNNSNTAARSAERHAKKAASALDAKLSGPLAPLEKALDDVFGSKAQYQLPADIKKLLIEIAPWLALLAGVLGIFSAYTMWRIAHSVNRWAEAINDAFNDLVPTESANLSLMFWVSIAMTLLFAVLALLAFPGLRAKKKIGWNLMFYSMIANVMYGIASLFYSGGGVSSLLGSIVASAIGLYILFQVRERYKV